MADKQPGQTVPVRIYQTEDHIMVVAPMPGLEPDNIWVIINSDQVIMQGEERGPGQHERDLLIAEWTFGPYYREVMLPQPVNAELSNATYGNGVLTLSMPKLVAGQTAPYAKFRLEPVSSTFGERVGHSGRKIEPTTTYQHQKRVRQAAGGESE